MTVTADKHKNIMNVVQRPLRATVLIALVAFLPSAHAQTPVDLAPSAGKSVAIEAIDDIRHQPLALLAKFPNAGPAMARFVAKEMAKQPAIVDSLMAIIPDTSPEQASAIGAGLVRAVRAMGVKQADQSRLITEKVMRSDNMWLKTTFTALGPRYRGIAPGNLPVTLPPREFVDGVDMGTGIGNDWRMGPEENTNLTARQPLAGGPNAPSEMEKCSSYLGSYEAARCRGMVVALVTSDADDNGAVSTSPTI